MIESLAHLEGCFTSHHQIAYNWYSTIYHDDEYLGQYKNLLHQETWTLAFDITRELRVRCPTTLDNEESRETRQKAHRRPCER